MQWKWNEKTEIGTGLAGVGALLMIGGKRGDITSSLFGLGMVGGGGYLLYDELKGEEEEGPPGPPGPPPAGADAKITSSPIFVEGL